jgi:hypothetical protein
MPYDYSPPKLGALDVGLVLEKILLCSSPLGMTVGHLTNEQIIAKVSFGVIEPMMT